MGPDEPGHADATTDAAAAGAKTDEEDGLPDVPPLELPAAKAAPVAVETDVNGLPAVPPPALPASEVGAVAADQGVNGR